METYGEPTILSAGMPVCRFQASSGETYMNREKGHHHATTRCVTGRSASQMPRDEGDRGHSRLPAYKEDLRRTISRSRVATSRELLCFP